MNARIAHDLLVLHPDPIVEAGVRVLLSDLPGLRPDPLRIVAAPGFDARLVVADYRQGMAWLHRARERVEHPGARMLLLLANEGDREVRAALASGVGGLLAPCCEIAEFRQAASSVLRGLRHLSPAVAHQLADGLSRTPLTERENAVLHLIAAGMSNKTIARELAISLCTVKTHVRAILEKLDVSSRTQAVSRAGAQRLIDPTFRRQDLPPALPS